MVKTTGAPVLAKFLLQTRRLSTGYYDYHSLFDYEAMVYSCKTSENDSGREIVILYNRHTQSDSGAQERCHVTKSEIPQKQIGDNLSMKKRRCYKDST